MNNHILKAAWVANSVEKSLPLGAGPQESFLLRKQARLFLIVLLVYRCGDSQDLEIDPRGLSCSSRQAHSNHEDSTQLIP